MAGDTMTKSIEPADEVIRGGTIIDGTGRPRFRSDVAVKNGRITAIGDLAGLRGRTEINAEGLVVAPGFIDAHAHSDTAFVRDDSGASKLYQGVTTEISGNCGDSPFPDTPGNKDPWQLSSFADFQSAVAGLAFSFSSAAEQVLVPTKVRPYSRPTLCFQVPAHVLRSDIRFRGI